MRSILCASLLLTFSVIFAQENDLDYYLPDISYNRQIPSPHDFLGYNVGDWHVTHDQLRFYMEALAEASDRVRIEEYARTYENRPLQLLTITSERNHARMPEILEYRRSLTESAGDTIDYGDQPAVIYQGYTIHGNEPSGSNAALLVAYYLAAGQGAEIDELLDNVVILLDPCFNPDGLQRFSTWANMHKNKNLTSDPEDREYSEAWPRGRTNHYWFDLNRDWLPVQHPESRGRVANFQKWKPNILTDHHEMGSNSTFFFMPGEPTRVNPTTPIENQQLTAEIAKYHARELDAIGSLYYSGEGFDDFYYGKGSTYPDAQGCIGILFEQASARGHLQETVNGLLSFPFAIRNQVATSISTQKAALELKDTLLQFQADFFAEGLKLAKNDSILAYAFGESGDPARREAFVEVLLRQGVEVYNLDDDHQDELTHIVPMQQAQYRMVKAIFDRQVEFEDSLFYDVSAWTLPLAYDIRHEALQADRFAESLVGDRVTSVTQTEGAVKGGRSQYGYILPWDEYYAPKAAYALLKHGLIARVNTKPFSALTAVGEMKFAPGALFFAAKNQSIDDTQVFLLADEAAKTSGVNIYSVTSGLTPSGPDMGSRSDEVITRPEILIAVGNGVNSYEAGELWHLMDQRYDIPVSKVEIDQFDNIDLSRYTAILLAGGNYRGISESGVDALKAWVRAGGTLITSGGAVNWATGAGLLNTRKVMSEAPEVNDTRRAYAIASRDRGANVVGGAIFQVEIDRTHPLFFGYQKDSLAVFKKGTDFYEPTTNKYATPARYSKAPLLAGYINEGNLEQLSGSASVIVGGLGRGRVIAFADNHAFRAFWWGTQKIIANAVFFGSAISGLTVESPPANK